MSFRFGYTSPPHSNRRDWHNVTKLVSLVWDFRGRILAALSLLVLAKLANVGVPLALKALVDVLDGDRGAVLALPVSLLAAYGFLRLSSSAFNELRDALFAKVRYRVIRRLSVRLMTHLHRLSLRFHLSRKTGAITRDLERGTSSISSILNYLIFNILPTFAEFSLVVGILFANYEPAFALITGGAVFVYVLFTVKVTEWRMHFRHSMNALDSEAGTRAVDSLINYETVKYFGNEALEARRYDATLGEWENAAVKSQTSMAALNFGQGAIIAIAVTFIMTIAAQGVIDGRMTIGDLVMVNAFLIQLFIPLNFLGVVYRQIKYSMADMDLLFRLMEEKPEIVDKPGAMILPPGPGSVRFENVSFAYDPDRPILHSVDLALAPGSKMAVVGASGAGKSTLARLLFRHYDVTSGAVYVDDHDVRSLTQASLRANIGIVPQDTVLFNETILYNIQYARPAATREEIEHAAGLAHIHDFIASLPSGYETVVGERGLKLSGGEKQRVAIARVFLKDPHILIFDEATSALDSHSERVIQAAMNEVAADRTTLVIAHRLSTIVDADQILVLDQGRIVEVGTHRELLSLESAYAQMWRLQQNHQDPLE